MLQFWSKQGYYSKEDTIIAHTHLCIHRVNV